VGRGPETKPKSKSQAPWDINSAYSGEIRLLISGSFIKKEPPDGGEKEKNGGPSEKVSHKNGKRQRKKNYVLPVAKPCWGHKPEPSLEIPP